MTLKIFVIILAASAALVLIGSAGLTNAQTVVAKSKSQAQSIGGDIVEKADADHSSYGDHYRQCMRGRSSAVGGTFKERHLHCLGFSRNDP